MCFSTAEEHITAIISFKTHFDKRISSLLHSGCSKKQRSLKSYVRSKMFARTTIAIIIHLPLKWCPFQKWKLLRSSYFTFRTITAFGKSPQKKNHIFSWNFFFVTKGQITNSNTFNFWNIFKNDFFLGIFQPLLSSIFDDKLVWFCVLFQKFMSHPQDNFRLLSIDILG